MKHPVERSALTDKRLRKWRFFKRYLITALCVLVMLVVGEVWAVDMRDIAAAIWGGIPATMDKIGVDIQQFPSISVVANVAIRIVSNGLVGAVIGGAITAFFNWLGVIDWALPKPPAFVFCDLETERRVTLLGAEADAPLPLFGRDAELASLSALLDSEGPKRFIWQSLTGPTGVGKTRLAVEWLARAEQQKWDIGVINTRQLAALDGWKARRPTALVLDEADSDFFRQKTGTESQLEVLLNDLVHASSKRHPIRLLLLGQSTIWAEGNAPESLRPYAAKEPLALAPLSDDAMAPLAEHLVHLHGGDTAGIIRESAGRPRHAIIMAKSPPGTATYEDALNEWANRLVPELRYDQDAIAPSFAIGLVASALVGPVQTDKISEDLPIRALLRLFPGARRADLEAQLPQLKPDDLAQVLALRALDHMHRPLRDEKLIPLLLNEPKALERSLGEIWRDHPHWVEQHRDHPVQDSWQANAAHQLRELQAAFDARWPDRILAMQKRIADAVDSMGEEAQLGAVNLNLQMATAIADARPFDKLIRLNEALVAVSAAYHFGEAGAAAQVGAFAALEHWSERLDDLLAVATFAADPAIRLQEARAVVNATNYYGKAGAAGQVGAFDALERWGGRLDALLAIANLAMDPAIRMHEAMATANAVLSYGMAAVAGQVGAFAALERWAERYDSLFAIPALCSDPAIRLGEAMAAVGAINYYGEAGAAGEVGAFSELERWGERLDALLAIPTCACDPAIRLREAMATGNAAYHYGEAGVVGQPGAFSELERWGERFAVLSANPAFAADSAIRNEEAGAAINAIRQYGEVGSAGQVDAFVALERWGKRLDAMLGIPILADDPAIRLKEARATLNAIYHYGIAGAAGNTDAFPALERWAQRIDAMLTIPVLAADAAIRLLEAKAAVNAIHYYGEAGAAGQLGAFAELERWGERFASLAAMPGFATDLAIRLEESVAAVYATLYYGKVGMAGKLEGFAALEQWGARFDAMVAIPALAADPAIRQHEAMAAANTILHYGKAGDEDNWRRWRGRLAKIIQRFPYHAEFTELATKQNLTLADQEAFAWPYGRYQWAEDGEEQTLQQPRSGYAA